MCIVKIILFLALLEQKSQFIFEEHSGFILPKKESIRGAPNGRRFLERPTEHVKSTHPYADPDFIKSKKLPPKLKKNNASVNLEEVIPVKKVVAVEAKRSNSFKGTQFSLVSKYSKKYCPLLLSK